MIYDTPIIVDVDTIVQKIGLEMSKKNDGKEYFGNGLRSGNNIQYKCPFHKDGQERRPSMGVHISSGMWNCLTCGDGGELPELIARCLKLGDPIKPQLGYKWLLDNFNLAVAGERPDLNYDISRGRENKVNIVPESEVQEYLSWSHPYMESERHISVPVQNLLEIGFDPETMSVVFPMRDLKGRCLFLKKRPVNPYNDARYINKKDTAKKSVMYGLWYAHKYKNIEPNDKFIERLNKYGIWYPEGEIDSASFWEAGATGASIGGKIFFDTQIREVRKVGAPFHVLALDNDEDGQKEMVRVSEEYEHLLKIKFAHYPSWAKDMNDVIKEGKDIGVVTVSSSLQIREYFT